MLQRLLLGLLVPVAVASCGGGGGGGGGPPPPSLSSQANLTSANAPAYATSVDLATRLAATMRLGQFLTATATPGTYTDGGCFAGGSAPANIVVTPATGTVTGTVTYSSFDQCVGLRLNGTANISGTLNVGGQVDTFNFTFSGLSFTALSGGQIYQMSGSATLQWVPGNLGAVSWVMTLNATVSGAASLRLENFVVNADVAAGVNHVLISGRLAMAEGFVDIAPTGAPVDLPQLSTGLQNGSVRMTGATTIATAFFNGGGVPPTITSIVPR